MVSYFLHAVRFLTVLPLPGKEKEKNLARAMFFFPLVGFLIGIISLVMVQGLSLPVFIRLEALGLVTFPLLLSGGLHLDGFADFCDGFFGGKDKEEVLQIMRDSRIGVWGAAGVTLLFFWKWELLASLSHRGSALLLALSASRWAQVVLAYFLPYANPRGGLGEGVAQKVRIRELAGASGFLFLFIFFLGARGVLTFVSLVPFLAGIGFLFWKRLGGLTGDLLGAASEATELFIFLILFLIRSGSYR